MLFTLYPFCDIVKLQIEKNRKIFNKKSEKTGVFYLEKSQI